jgi:hypothetical protein
MYLVVTPVALLRARTSLGKAAAVFIPVAAFHLGRLIVPGLVTQGMLSLPWGDSVLSANVLLNLALAWVLYSKIDAESQVAEEEDGIQAEPLAV